MKTEPHDPQHFYQEWIHEGKPGTYLLFVKDRLGVSFAEIPMEYYTFITRICWDKSANEAEHK